jgi:signal transduction histidine kinase
MTLARLPARGLVDGVRATDAVLPAVVAVIGTAELVAGGYDPLWVALGTYWLACAGLCLRRRFPLTMPVLVAAWFSLGALAGVPVGDPASWILPETFACFAAGRYGPWPACWPGHWRGLVAVLTSLGLSFVALDAFTDFDPDMLFGVIGTVVPWLLGRGLRRELDRSSAFAAKAERVLLERENAVREAAVAERDRIARELHDVLAHSLSVMVVQSSLAEDLLSRDPRAAAAALQEVQQCGRNALAETGRLLRLIRDDEDELGLRPERGVSEIRALAADYCRAGLQVSVEIEPEVTANVPVGMQLSLYRIVQEALTNVLKHAPGSPVDVHLARAGDELRVSVRNGAPSGSPRVVVQGGHGLTGVRERVALFGGSLHHGTTGDGGFQVSASLPLTEAAV